jgi:hypothetical protein
MAEHVQECKTEKAMREVARWRALKRKGRIVLHFDGSGEVQKVEACVYIA